MDRKFTATVVRATGSWYDVLHDGETVRCRIRGRLRLKGVRSTNPVVVGDEVACEADEGGDYVIADILPRRNYVIRRASNLSKESHIIAANVDQALLMASLRSPETPTEFVDRFLVTCEAYKVPVTILLSKLDLQDAEATGMLFGLKGTHGRAQINRAALEAVGYSTYQHLLLFEELGVPPRRIITAGGGTKNAAWMQIICDMAGMPLTIPELSQCSSYGDAMLAALGVGALESFAALRAALPQGRILQPDRKNHEFYQEHYPIFRDLYLENRDRMHRMQK